jgi:Na+/H+-dicarboxylate symporter
MSYTQKIVIAMIGGILVGAAINGAVDPGTAAFDFVVNGVFDAAGKIFVTLLQMMVVPLVLVSLVCGVMALGDVTALGRIGAKTVGLYLGTTAVAVTIALSLAALVSPGEGYTLAGDVAFESREAPSFKDVLINMFPANPVRALADGQMLQIIVFALLLGFAMTQVGEAGRRVGAIFDDLNEIVMKMVLIVIKTAPIGVFALIAETFATEGFDIFGPLLGYFVTVILALAAHMVVTYSLLLRASGLSPFRFLGKMRAVMAFAFSTSSSGATIPLTLNTVEKRLGVKNSVASFTIPLGATVNMDGTAIMQGVATVFVANVYNVTLGFGDIIAVILTATLASVGTAAVPSAGLIMLAMVLKQVGLPVQGIALIIGIDRLLDMLRTAVNVTGDATVTCVIARTEGAIDQTVFDDPEVAIDSAPAPRTVEERR